MKAIHTVCDVDDDGCVCMCVCVSSSSRRKVVDIVIEEDINRIID